MRRLAPRVTPFNIVVRKLAPRVSAIADNNHPLMYGALQTERAVTLTGVCAMRGALDLSHGSFTAKPVAQFANHDAKDAATRELYFRAVQHVVYLHFGTVTIN